MKEKFELYVEEDEIESDGDNIYSEKDRNQLLEDDELSAAEEGFMIGYLEA